MERGKIIIYLNKRRRWILDNFMREAGIQPIHEASERREQYKEQIRQLIDGAHDPTWKGDPNEK